MTKRGASLIWAMVMSTALLFIAVTTATFVIRESQMSIRMDESSLAYAAAESGIDWGKYCVQSLSQCKNLTTGNSFGPSTFYVGGSMYVVLVKKEATQTKIESTGTSNGVNRKLEHVIKNINYLDRVLDTNLTATLQTNGSYVQQFDYWASGSSFANIGLGNSSTAPTQGIYLRHADVSGTPYIYLTTKNGTTIKESGLSLSGVGSSSPYSLRIRIEYFKDLSAKMTVSKRNFVTGMPEFSCIDSALVVDVRDLGLSPSSFTKFYFNSTLTTVTSSSYGDGSVKKLTSGGSEAYFDNMSTSGISFSTTTALVSISQITGTLQVGKTIFAGNVTPSGATVTYQWQKAEKLSGEPYVNINTATASTYTLLPADVGMYLRVRATGTGSYTGTVQSVPTTTAVKDVPLPTTIPVYRFSFPSEHFYTTNTAEGGTYTNEGVAFNAYSTSTTGTAPVYRFYHQITGRHFYTTNISEPVYPWVYEGPVFHAYPSQVTGSVSVYRFKYKTADDRHFYTTSFGEPDLALWEYEGVAFYAR